MKPTSPVLVVFDMDGTLTRRDTMFPFLKELLGPVTLSRLLVRHSVHMAGGLLGLTSRDGAKARLLRSALSGRDQALVDGAVRDFVASRRYAWREEVLDLLRWHQSAGHEVAVISAGLEVYVRPLVQQLGIERVAATQLEVVDGVFTGSIVGENVRGVAKAAHLLSLQAGRTLRIVAYGDSEGDRELLEAVDHPVWCGRRRPQRSGHLHLEKGGTVLTVLAERLTDVPSPTGPPPQ